MTKHTNILNSPQERSDILKEFPEMKEIDDFLNLMWEVINFTPHSEQETDHTVTNVKRYENALIALFGKNYSKARIPPTDYTYNDMRGIALQRDETGNLEGAIKDFLLDIYPIKEFEDKQKRVEYEGKRQTEFQKDFEAIKKHFYAARHLYEGENFENGKGFPWG